MGRLRLAILEEDSDYVSGIASFIINNYPSKFQVLAFTEIESYKNFCKTGMGIDILLVSSSIFHDLPQEAIVSKVILLSNSKVCAQKQNLVDIYKFQHGDKLVDEILHAYSNREGASNSLPTVASSNTKRCHITAVISASGGVGKTAISSALCISAASKGEKCFYLNLDSLQETCIFDTANDQQAGMSKVLYHLKEGAAKALTKLEGCRSISKVAGVHHFGGFENCNEAEDITVADIQTLFEWFSKFSGYSRVVVDLPSHINSMYLKVLELSDEIMIINIREHMSEINCIKLYNFLHKYDAANGTGIVNKLQLIQNKDTPDSEVNVDCDFSKLTPIKASFPYCPELISDCSEKNIYRLQNNNPIFTCALSQALGQ